MFDWGKMMVHHPTRYKMFRFRNLSNLFIGFAAVWFLVVMNSHRAIVVQSQRKTTAATFRPLNGADEVKVYRKEIPRKNTEIQSVSQPVSSAIKASTVFSSVLERANTKQQYCQSKDPNFTAFVNRFSMKFGKDEQELATLPAFGIIDAIKKEQAQPTTDPKWQCILPPESECGETQLTVVFMAYNPDRLGITLKEIRKLLSREAFSTLVKECILVWNGPREVDESPEGRELLEFAKENALRVVYPLKMGFPNDLMNRYHPDVLKVTTKALLYYDDDGPFYSYKAIESGFELWKRNSNAQIGAMSRQINYSSRQKEERAALGSEPNDKLFVSHCDNLQDEVEYNFYYFANYDANMVLPSGSMLHSNYLCFLWHPIFSDIRKFVLAHPVHPDDITVSTIVSHLAGRAPKVYSRRLNPDTESTDVQRRRLSEEKKGGIGGICWDCGSGMTEKKQIWADLRSQAINTLIRYFGSINSGSIGWCEGTEYYDPTKKDGKCKPIMAKQGWLPWMNKDGTPKTTCL